MAAFFQISLPLIAFVVYVKYANGYSAIWLFCHLGLSQILPFIPIECVVIYLVSDIKSITYGPIASTIRVTPIALG